MKADKNKVILIMALLAIVVTVIVMELKNNSAPSPVTGANRQESEFSVGYENGSRAAFYTYGKSIFFCTKDAMQLLNEKGEIVYSDTYTMNTPYMIHDKNIVAVCEKGGRTAKVYNEQSKLYDIQSEYPITVIALNSKGNCVVIGDGDTVYALNVYSETGNIIFNGELVPNDGSPVAADISDNGKVLAISYLDTNDIYMQARVLFYYVSSSAENEEETNSDHMFASFVEDDQLVGIVKFLEGDRFAAVSDKAIITARVNADGDAKCQEIWRLPLQNRLKAVDFPDNRYIAVVYGKPFINLDNYKDEDTVQWFSFEGEQVNEYVSDREVVGLNSDYGATIVQTNRLYKAINVRGGVIWEYHAIQDVNEILFFTSANKILLVGQNKADMLNINKKIMDDGTGQESETLEAQQDETMSAAQATETESTEITTDESSSNSQETTERPIKQEAAAPKSSGARPAADKITQTETVEQKTTAPETTAPETTMPETTAPETTAPEAAETKQDEPETDVQEPDGPIMPE